MLYSCYLRSNYVLKLFCTVSMSYSFSLIFFTLKVTIVFCFVAQLIMQEDIYLLELDIGI